jgi:hypothetical protein
MDIREQNTQEELETMHDEMLDEIYPIIKIGNLTFYPSNVLATCDPIAYELSVDEYIDFLQEQEDEE